MTEGNKKHLLSKTRSNYSDKMHYTVAYGLQNTQIILSQTQTIALFFFLHYFFSFLFLKLY